MMSEIKVLVVDDDIHICELVRIYLAKEGFTVLIAHNGLKAQEIFASENPDLVILDIMLPGIDGWQLCRNIRHMSDVPIIMMTAKGETMDKVTGLSIGADDYIVKPVDTKELVARVNAVLRRTKSEEPIVREVKLDNLSINIGNYTLIVKGEAVAAAPKEIELLFFLATNPNRVFTREQLLNQIWGYNYFGDSRTVDVHVKRIREKIDGVSDKWKLCTVWGVGYMFETL